VSCLDSGLSPNSIAIVQQYLQYSKQYYENSNALLRRNERAKAGEFLWGAIAEATKALHLMVKKVPVSTHRGTISYLYELVTQYRDRCAITKEHVSAAERLHSNFYHANLLEGGDSTFLEQYEYGTILFGFLNDLIKKYPSVIQ
jgi:hypothetical protein